MRHLFYAYARGSMRGMSTNMTPQQRRSQQRRGAADRARKYRVRHRIAGRPLPRDVDSAITEAMAFWLAREKGTLPSMAPTDVAIPLGELLRIARKILVDRVGMDRAETTDAMSRRLSERDEHRQPDFMPSLRPRN